jgi:hypothetical protein
MAPRGASQADPITSLIESLQAAQRLSPLELTAVTPDLARRATSLLAAARADAMIELTRDRHTGMSKSSLARELGITPAAVGAVIKERLSSLSLEL